MVVFKGGFLVLVLGLEVGLEGDQLSLPLLTGLGEALVVVLVDCLYIVSVLEFCRCEESVVVCLGLGMSFLFNLDHEAGSLHSHLVFSPF